MVDSIEIWAKLKNSHEVHQTFVILGIENKKVCSLQEQPLQPLASRWSLRLVH